MDRFIDVISQATLVLLGHDRRPVDLFSVIDGGDRLVEVVAFVCDCRIAAFSSLFIVTDRTGEAHVRDLLARKYWMAWIASWFGRGPERTFRVDELTPAG